ncbi:uncharacterized protein LOC124284851 [Haliotis rubra]|uniref:uncharacterized protein LOC124284851 n=1 Tax=Haliotis rubra TaxID=36100 RepID=UPI001EE53D1F|nr:uncharacterized protein LOC124284851 [Haliotis rubra]
MGATRRYSVSYFILLFILPAAAGLYCYQCGSTGNEGFCKTEIKTLIKSADDIVLRLQNSTADATVDDTDSSGRTTPNIKKCANFRNVCLIETVENAQTSQVLSYIRDCSDGKTFSFGNLTMLQGIQSNNYTTCGYDTRGYMSCITTCSENFCNGPKADATMPTIWVPLAFLWSIIRFMFL